MGSVLSNPRTHQSICQIGPIQSTHAPVDVPVPLPVQPADRAARVGGGIVAVQGVVRRAHHQLVPLKAAAQERAVARVVEGTRGVDGGLGEPILTAPGVIAWWSWPKALLLLLLLLLLR